MKSHSTSPNYSPGIHPINFVVRYNPPSIGLIYKVSPTIAKKRKYEIFLNGLITLPSSELITKQLFLEHSIVLRPDICSFEQIQRLVDKILSNIEIIYDEEEGNNESNNENSDNNGYYPDYIAPYQYKPYMDGVCDDNNDNSNNNNDNYNENEELDKSFEIEKEEENVEHFKGKGRIGFLKNLRKK